MAATANDILSKIKEEEIEWVDLRFTDPKGKWQHLTMVAGLIGEVVSGGLTSYAELDSVLDLEDLYDLAEIGRVNSHNRAIIKAAQEKQ